MRKRMRETLILCFAIYFAACSGASGSGGGQKLTTSGSDDVVPQNIQVIEFDGTVKELSAVVEEDVQHEEEVEVPYQTTCTRQVQDGYHQVCETNYRDEQQCGYEQQCTQERECHVESRCHDEQQCTQERECRVERQCHPERVCDDRQECHDKPVCNTRRVCEDQRDCHVKPVCSTREVCEDSQECNDVRKCEVVNGKRECKVEHVCNGRPRCHKVQDCHDERECTNRPVCRDVEDCHNERVCETNPVCRTENRCSDERVCDYVPRCHTAPVCNDERVCDYVPRCHDEYVCHSVPVPYQDCHDEPSYKTETYACTETRTETQLVFDYHNRVEAQIIFEGVTLPQDVKDQFRIVLENNVVALEGLNTPSGLAYYYTVELKSEEVSPQQYLTHATLHVRAVDAAVGLNMIKINKVVFDKTFVSIEKQATTLQQGWQLKLALLIRRDDRTQPAVLLERELSDKEYKITQVNAQTERLVVQFKDLGLDKEMLKKGTYKVDVQLRLEPSAPFLIAEPNPIKSQERASASW